MFVDAIDERIIRIVLFALSDETEMEVISEAMEMFIAVFQGACPCISADYHEAGECLCSFYR